MLVMEELLKPEDVARILKLSEYTVKDMLRAGTIRGTKTGNRWRVHPDDLRAYMEAQRAKKH